MRSFLILGLSAVVLGTECINDPTTEGVITEGLVELIDDPLRNFDAIMIPIYNGSAIEDWSHDAVSTDGSTGLAFTSSRGSIGGVPGAQRLFLAAVWPNGTRYMENTFTEASNIETCPYKTTTRWFNATGGLDWTFEYSTDFQDTLVTINSPTIKGSITLKALVPPLYPNGLEYPNPKGKPLFAPWLYWVENVPMGVIEANLTILDTPFVLRGFGGRERNWLSRSWADTSANWDMMRGVVGPYSYIGWMHHSNVEGSQFSMVLLRDDKVVFRTERSKPFNSEPWASITQTADGPFRLTSGPGDEVSLPDSTFTGYALEMVAPESGDHWKFDMDFTQTVYWFPAGKSALIGGYAANVTGGLVGDSIYEGLGSGNLQELISEA